MPRTVPEWFGKTDDTKPPRRVCVRVFRRAKGTCHWCKNKIHADQSWQTDHVHALINGGENRESNLAPIHEACHPEKTAEDVAAKAKSNRIIGKTLVVEKVRQITGRPFPKSKKSVRRKARGQNKPSFPPKPLFEPSGKMPPPSPPPTPTPAPSPSPPPTPSPSPTQ